MDEEKLQRFFFIVKEDGPLTVWQNKQTVL